MSAFKDIFPYFSTISLHNSKPFLFNFYLSFQDLEHREGREAKREAERQRREDQANIRELVRVQVAREVNRLRLEWEWERRDQ